MHHITIVSARVTAQVAEVIWGGSDAAMMTERTSAGMCMPRPASLSRSFAVVGVSVDP